MIRHSSKRLMIACLPLLLAGCIKVYTTPQEDKLTVPPPPGPETLDPSGPQGGEESATLTPAPPASPAPAVTVAPVTIPTPMVETLKPSPERPLPGQLRAQQATSTINVREGPGTQYAVLFKAHPNDTVTLTNEAMGADGYVWYEVNHSGWGWIREDLLNVQADVATVVAKQERSSINVREGPSQTYRVIHVARVGDRFPVMDKTWDSNGYAWYLLDLNYIGWVRGDLVVKGTAGLR